MSLSLSSTAAAYFSAEYFKQRYTRDLNDALREQRIDAQEYQWLAQLRASPPPTDHPVSNMRVDRLRAEGGSLITGELAAALVISHHAPDDTRTYLHSALHGLRRFENSRTLLDALPHANGFSADAHAALTLERIAGDPFEQCLLNTLEQRVQQLASLSKSLERLPSLPHTLKRSLTRHLEGLVPGIDPAAHCLHIVRRESERGESLPSPWVVQVQSLLDALLDDCVGRALGRGRHRVFLDAQGRAVDAEQSAPWQRAMTDSLAELRDVFEAALEDHWGSLRTDGLTHRQGAALALSEHFTRQVRLGDHSSSLSPSQVESLLALLPGQGADLPAGQSVVLNRLSVSIGDQVPLKLAGMIFIECAGDTGSVSWLYSPDYGLKPFASRDLLKGFLAARADLVSHLSLNDQALFAVPGVMHLRFDAIAQPLFTDLADSIIALQKRNLSFALGRIPGRHLEAEAMIDDALDIRSLLDPAFLHLSCNQRWLEERKPFLQRWTTSPTDDVAGVRLPPENPEPLAWSGRLAELDEYSRSLLRARPQLESCARDALNLYLAVVGETPLDALDIQVQCGIPNLFDEQGNGLSQNRAGQTREAVAISLVHWFIEWVSGYRQVPLAPDCQVLQRATDDGVAQALPELPARVLNHVVDRIGADFPAQQVQSLQAFQGRSYSHGGTLLRPGTTTLLIRQDLLWLECGIKQQLNVMEPRHLALFEQVLQRPTRQMRHALGNDAAEVYGLSLLENLGHPGVGLSNAFVIRQPLSGRHELLFWSAIEGLQRIPSLELLELKINLYLTSRQSREKWLGLLAEDDAIVVRSYLARTQRPRLKVILQRCDGHFIDGLQEVEQYRQDLNLKREWQFARDCGLPAGVCRGLLDLAVTDDRITTVLEGVAEDLRAWMFEALLPDWISGASIVDMQGYAELLSRCYQVNGGPDQEEFLADVPSMSLFAREQLLARLKVDFPGGFLDPDAIWITMTRYIAAPPPLGEIPSAIAAATQVDSETLTDFSLNHFSSIQDAVLTVRFGDDSSQIPGFDARYVQQLIRELDVGKGFRQLIAAKFTDPAQNALRRERFIKQMPTLLLIAAYELKLQKQLSARAYDFIESIIDMPDDTARQPVHGQAVRLRPLELLAQADMAADPVSGLFLIGPDQPGQGPLILHAMFSEAFCFREFPDEAALLAELRTPGMLQDMVLSRIAPAVHGRYANGGFAEAHVPWSTEGFADVPLNRPGPVTLARHPVTGNALDYLFEQTLSAFSNQATRQTVSTAEADWQSFVYLMSLGAGQVLTFLPGRLGALVGIWQSMSMLRNALAAAGELHWGKALSEFSAALAVMISSRQAKESLSDVEPVPQWETSMPRSGIAWSNGLSAELRSRLQAMEVNDVALNRLQRDERNLYLDPDTARHYAAVAGRVFEVSQDQGRWRIVGAGDPGPWLKPGVDRQWLLDLGGLRGGGIGSSRFSDSRRSAVVDAVFMIEASGMAEIRGNYLAKAQAIEEAHQQALVYLKNALYNLRLIDGRSAIHPQSIDLISGFFGLQQPDPLLIKQIRDTTQALFLALTSWDWSPLSSSRYVVGTNKAGYESTVAFTLDGDARKRMYLTERFFRIPLFHLRQHASYSSFSAAAHYRATTLLHEMSHLIGKTQDIAYLESSAPFTDLLSDDTQEGTLLKEIVTAKQRDSLSHLSSNSELFKTFSSSGLRDLQEGDGDARRLVLHITGQSTLDEARRVFLSDEDIRSRVILKNADSVALLITRLGRYRLIDSPV